MLEVADVFRRYGDDYRKAFGGAMLPSHHRALTDILRCRTAALGGQVYACDQCGHREYAYHSCRNRNCPKCHTNDTEAWLDQRRQELLPVPYFHVVFTLPHELGRIVRRHQQSLYAVLMKAATIALMKLAADPHYVGGQIGILAVLHTWTRTLEYHPHVHCLVPAGGVLPDGQWRPARKDYLVPVRALSKMFRGIFRDLARRALPDLHWPGAIYKKDWVVYCKPTLPRADRVLQYLGRYVHRVAIANRRILSIDDGRVVFRYQRADDVTWRTMTLSAREFIRRFLQHVLPAGVHKVRYYGLWAPSNRRRLRRIQQALAIGSSSSAFTGLHDGALEQPSPVPALSPTPNALPETPRPSGRAGQKCPGCGQGILIHIARVERMPHRSRVAGSDWTASVDGIARIDHPGRAPP